MRSAPPSLSVRIAVAMLAALVLVLALASVSPSLHAWLHGGTESAEGARQEEVALTGVSAGQAERAGHEEAPAGHPDHACAVTLFAGGLIAWLIFCLVFLAAISRRGLAWRAVDRICPARPHYWLVPSHGPPVV